MEWYATNQNFLMLARTEYIYTCYSSVHHLDQPTINRSSQGHARSTDRTPRGPAWDGARAPARAEAFPREPIASACPEPIDPARAEASPRAPTHAPQPFFIFTQSF
jgi:hypothetical protein